MSLTNHWHRFRPYLPFLAFGCGFVFDSVTLGREVSRFDLVLVSFYATIALVMILLATRNLSGRLRQVADTALQFCLGGSLSAVVVLYFRSTGQLYSLVFIAVLFVAMVYNELAHRDGPQRNLVWAMWCISGAMLANFVIPHIVGSVSPLWFYLSVAATLATVHGVRAIVKAPWASVRLATIAALILALLWALGFVPPVPLVLRNNLVCTDYQKADGEYRCDVDEPGVWQQLGLRPIEVSRDEGQPVYVLTAVFAPRDVDVTMQHRWYRDTDEGWKLTDEMSFDMTGGRKDGWRFWSRKRHVSPGLYKVETLLEGGAVLGYERFTVTSPANNNKRSTAL